MTTTEVKTLSATVVEEDTAPRTTEVKTLSATVVEQSPAFNGLAQVNAGERPDYIVENGTPYVRFAPETNNKQLFFYPEEEGEYIIIVLRPNLLDFFESTQTFTIPAQVEVPHFNQLFMSNRVVDEAERIQIKRSMLKNATGTGIDIDAGTPNSVPGGLKDPFIEGTAVGTTDLTSIVDLFAAGQQGGLFDAGTISTVFTDVIRTTEVSTSGPEAVAYIEDYLNII